MPAPEIEQLTFNWLLGNQEWFSPKELAERVGMTRRYWEIAYDNGGIAGQGHNSKCQKGKRSTMLFHRSWVSAYLVQTANYDHQMKLEMGLNVLAAFDKGDLVKLRNRIDYLLTQ